MMTMNGGVKPNVVAADITESWGRMRLAKFGIFQRLDTTLVLTNNMSL
jgi:hypothetical protein